MTTYTVTVSNVGGANKYYINGDRTPNLMFVSGSTYVFNLSDSTNANHPLLLSETMNGTHNSGTAFEDQVTYKIDDYPVARDVYLSQFKDAESRQIEIRTSKNYSTIYYYCHNHSGMANDAKITTSVPTPPMPEEPPQASSIAPYVIVASILVVIGVGVGIVIYRREAN